MIKLAKYQQKSMQWLYENPYIILGDDPGVGKTHPAIFAAKQVISLSPNLIVCPAYLAENWKYELERCGETDIVVIVSNTPKEKRQLLKEHHTWTIISYAFLSMIEYKHLLAKKNSKYHIDSPKIQMRIKYRKLLLDNSWATLIFDEAHRLRNRNSLSTRAAHHLRKRVDRIWMLTGTPTVANSGDLFPLLKLCDPKKYSSYWRFVNEHCHLVQNPWTTIIGELKNSNNFHNILKKYMLRRTLHNMLPNIPEVIEQTITVELSKANRSLYDKAKKEFWLGDNPLLSGGAVIAALRQLTSRDEAKINAVLGLIEDLPNEKIIIFTWYRATVKQIVDKLNADNVYSITGANTAKNKQEIIGKYRGGSEQKILVATLGALKEGVNLQFGRIVIFIEEDWLAATNDQAVARLHRRGQTQTVLKYVIHANKTVDQTVHRIQKRRGEMSLQAVIREEFK